LTDRFSLRVTPTIRRALAERLPESVAFAAFEFINASLEDRAAIMVLTSKMLACGYTATDDKDDRCNRWWP
jgi:hypothetical protein